MPGLLSKKVVIQNKRGLHARAAAKVTSLAAQFDAEIFVLHGDKKVSALSLMGLLILTAHQGAEIEFQAFGKESHFALSALSKLVNARFDEEN